MRRSRALRTHKRIWTQRALILLLIITVVSGGLTVRDLLRARAERAANKAVAGKMHEILELYRPAGAKPDLEGALKKEKDPARDPSGKLIQYSDLSFQNTDMFGWITVPDTQIDYPVMQVPGDTQYYLHRNFDKQYAVSGSIFLDGKCTAEGKNWIVYGHRMKDGSMFGELVKYDSEEFAQTHSEIAFHTLYDEDTYEIVAAFYSKVHKKTDTDVFRYYYYTDLSDPSVFEEYMNWVNKVKLYDTGVEPVYGDTLLTLTTCSYHVKNGRFVVIARKIN